MEKIEIQLRCNSCDDILTVHEVITDNAGKYAYVDPCKNCCRPTKDALDGELPCLACGGEVGHRINCPHGIAFSSPPVI